MKFTISVGGIAAIACSWALNHSVIWAILHSFLSWVYVVYAFFFRNPEFIAMVRRLIAGAGL